MRAAGTLARVASSAGFGGTVTNTWGDGKEGLCIEFRESMGSKKPPLL
jgi:hypothetical protein